MRKIVNPQQTRLFDPVMGRSTKKLYSTAELILLMEFIDWTKNQALDVYYSYHTNVQLRIES